MRQGVHVRYHKMNKALVMKESVLVILSGSESPVDN
jgi:hypothetical protein